MIKIIEAKSKEWFEFEVDPGSKIWNGGTAIRQVFNELKLKAPSNPNVGRWALLLGAPKGEGGTEKVPSVTDATDVSWQNIGARDGDSYYLAFVAGGGDNGHKG